MSLRTPEIVLILVGLCCSFTGTPVIGAQDLFRVMISLKLNDQRAAVGGLQIKFDETPDGSPRLGEAPGGTLVAIERSSDPKFAYRIKVDSDGDGGLEGEISQNLSPDSPALVWILRKWTNGKQQRLPYTVRYSAEIDKANQKREHFLWAARYRVEGKLIVNGGEALFTAVDLNGNGVFDKGDFSMGTSIGLDRNGDGRIEGKDEWLKGEQIIEFCGASLLIENLYARHTKIWI